MDNDNRFVKAITIRDLKEKNILPLVHGNGFLQISLNEDRSIRLHIWHPDLPSQKVSTQIHNHTFGFQSEVMFGGIINQVYDAVHTDGIMNPMHICEAVPVEGKEDTELKIIADPLIDLREKYIKYIKPGEKYYFPPFEYHHSVPIGFTATIMRKTIITQGFRARVLCGIYDEPDNNFSRYGIDQYQLWNIVDETLNRIKYG